MSSTPTTPPTGSPRIIAFIGLGNMGLPMAANLVAAGHTVLGYDPGPGVLDRAAEAGVRPAASAQEAAAEASVVVTMLTRGEVVKGVYGEPGGDGLLAAAPAGTLFVDCSTISVEDARELADRAVAAGHRAVDAPVSGGIGGAAAGTLTFMVGCRDEDLEEVAAVLDPMAGRVVHCGGPGVGQTAKMCNNMVLGISMTAVAEAFVLGERLGLSHQAFFDVASTASGQCWSLTTNCPVPGPVPTSPANRDYQPGFASALMSKDLDLAQAAAQLAGVDTRLGALAADEFRRFVDAGGAGLDFSAIITDVRARSGADS